MDLKLLQDTPPWEWPQNSGKIFRKVLTDPRARAADRLIAADLAGDAAVVNDELASALLSIVVNRSEPEPLRVQAALSLGPALETAAIGFDEPEEALVSEPLYLKIQKQLREVYEAEATPKQLRRRVLEASIRAPEEWHGAAVRRAYLGGDREWLLTAAFAMRWIKGFEPEILALLNSSDPETQMEAVEAAGEWELDGAWPLVTELAQSGATPKPLLLAAISAVGTIRPKEAVLILADLAESEDEDIAEAADEALMMAETLSNIGDEEADGIE